MTAWDNSVLFSVLQYEYHRVTLVRKAMNVKKLVRES